MKSGVKLIDLVLLKKHEAVDPVRVEELASEISKDGILRNPLVVDQQTMVVLDGHHRFAALQKLGAKRAPVHLVNYQDKQVRVYLRRKELLGELIKAAVINKALSGEIFPQKTTRHLLKKRVLGINCHLKHLY
ncbi:ParB N-terminal domain-containing protein [Patescibacteria group bacterium]